jgi:hypothetical protein
MIPTNYSSPPRRGSFWKTAFLTTVLALCNAFLFAQTTCAADAGSLNGEICIQNQEFTLKANLRGDTTVPNGFRILYVLTRGDSLVITEVSDEASFDIDSAQGTYRIHTLVYDSTTLNLGSVVLGTTTAGAIFRQLVAGGGTICAALDTAGVRFRFGDCDEDDDACEADAGRLTAVAGACLGDSTATLRATIADSAEIPSGFSLLYLLTRTDSLVIEEANTQPTFTVDTTGRYRIHVLVYDSTTLDLDSLVDFGTTTGGAVNALLVQGGGEICAALDVAGALFNIVSCTDTSGVDSCNIDLGRLAVVSDSCTDNNGIVLTARVQSTPIVPAGFVVRYVLASGDSSIILQTSTTPVFSVDSVGTYSIHTFIYDPATFDTTDIDFGNTTRQELFSQFIQGGGDICGAIEQDGVVFDVGPCCSADAGVLTFGGGQTCLSDSTLTLRATVVEAPTVPAGYQVIYVLTSGNDLVIRQVNDTATFVVDTTGRFTIHTLVYDSTTLDLGTVVFDSTRATAINALLIQGGGEICAALDVEGVVFNVDTCSTNPDTCTVTSGSLRVVDEDYCIDSTGTATLRAAIQTVPNVPPGYQITYLLSSGDSLVAEQVSDTATFIVDTVGRYRIHIIVYDSTTLNLDSVVVFGTTTGADVDSLFQDTICGAINLNGVVFDVALCADDTTGVDSCNIAAGTVQVANDTFCLNDSIATLTATTATGSIVPDGFTLVYVLTRGDSLIIEGLDSIPTFTVDTVGRYRIHPFVYDTTDFTLLDSLLVLGSTSAASVLPLTIENGGTLCADLDPVGALFDVRVCGDTTGVDSCDAEAGTVRVANEDFCLGDSTATLTVAVVDSAEVPDGFAFVYVLTSGDSLIIEDVDTIPSFTVDTIGRFRIHPFVFDTTAFSLADSLVTLGETSALSLLPLLVSNGGTICADLDATGALFDVRACGDTTGVDTCGITLGRLTPLADSCVSGGGLVLTAQVETAPTVPAGYRILYILTTGDSAVITQISTSPTFTTQSPGAFTIYTLIYDPATFDSTDIVFGTTTRQTLARLFTGGGGALCGAIDQTGAEFDLGVCCGADVGRLSAASSSCISDSTATLTATVIQAATVPNGFSLLYVLTRGDSLIIDTVSTTPSFTVSDTGRYTIHTLVYDSTTLDLGIVNFGSTPATAVNALLIQGGGEICAALDVQGVVFDVVDCSNDSLCVAQAGEVILLGDEDEICLDTTGTDSVTLRVSVQTASVIPPGFSSFFVLTRGDSLTLLATDPNPSFTVDTVGEYRIGLVVYDTTDFDFLDSIIVFGQTSALSLLPLAVENGGTICASFDTTGVLFNVGICGDTTGVDTCAADAGSLSAVGRPCLEDSTATLTAEVTDAPTVPAGYQVIYVLTSGTDLVIEQVSDSASFTVDTTGRFTIHTLVYDSTTLDLSIVQPGVTRATEVNALLVQGGGEICAALDVRGASFNLISCDSTGVDTCGVTFDTGVLQIIGPDVRCFNEDSASVTLRFIDAPAIPSGYAAAIVISQGDENAITQVITSGLIFTVDSADLYRIQLLVYDSTTTDLDELITFGSTTTSDLSELFVAGGGEICASLDSNSIVLDVRDCDGEIDCDEDVSTGTLFAGVDGACLNANGQATLAARVVTPAEVPLGYQLLYVLTSGSNLVIEAVGQTPSFTVDTVGQFRIHVLVYNPNTLNIGSIVLGTTTAGQVNALLIQGGGEICAALDTVGIRFDVRDCQCGANAGRLDYTRPGGRFTCLNNSGISFLAGNTRQRATVPLGYRRIYVLTSGNNLIIERVADIPVFGVRETGTYRIHTLVYDPNTLDLSTIQFGVTSANTIQALLRQGGGSICAALELPGLLFTVSTNCGSGVTAFPNPATTQVTVGLPEVFDIPNVDRITIEVIDVNGNTAKTWQQQGWSENARIDVSDLQPGMYYLRVLYDQTFVQEMNIVKVR